MNKPLGFSLVALLFFSGISAQAQEKKGALPVDAVNKMSWRSIGPANMSGRITSIAVFEADPSTWWASSASGMTKHMMPNDSALRHMVFHES